MTKFLPRLQLSFALMAISLPAVASVPAAGAAAQQMSSHAVMAVPPVAVLAAAPATAEQMWQLRSALNVAALMCGDRSIVAGYNLMLRAHAPILAHAWSSEQQRFQRSHGSLWQTAQDRHLTSQYNLYANTGDRSRFCTEARTIVTQARLVPANMFAHFAASAVSRLPHHTTQVHLAAR